MKSQLTGPLWRLFAAPARPVPMLILGIALGVLLTSASVLAAEIEVVNKTSIDSGDFPLRANIENDVIFLRGKFLSRTIAGDRILGGLVLDVVFEGNGGELLSRITIQVKPSDLDVWYDKPIGAVLPHESGMKSEALRRVIVTAREFNTEGKEARRRQKEREVAARRLEEKREAERREVEKAFPATTKMVADRLRESRRFQEPMDALNNWGDPTYLYGAMSPQMVFTVHGLGSIALSYLPPVRSPNRLEFIDIGITPAPAERQVIEWLGPPVKVEKQEYRGQVFVYQGRDAARLRVLFLYWGQDVLNIRFDGRR